MDKSMSVPDLRAMDWPGRVLRGHIRKAADRDQPDPDPHPGSSLPHIPAALHDGLLLLAAADSPDSPEEDIDNQVMDTGILDTDSDSDSYTQSRYSSAQSVANSGPTLPSISAPTVEVPTAEVSGVEAIGVSVVPSLGSLYYQCRSTRSSVKADVLVSLSQDETFGSMCESPTSRIGSFDSVNDGIEKTFHGCRVRKGATEVNQAISMSFDPAGLVCVSCTKQHPVFQRKPVTIFVSDQNFVENLSTKGTVSGDCLNVVRLEDASLEDLADIVGEILEGRPPPDGSVFMFGSASYLHQVGVTCYAQAWVALVEKLSAKWKNVRICPLIPLIRDDCPGSLARELQELASWFVSVYHGNTLGMSESWSVLSSVLIRNSDSGNLPDRVDRYRVALPTSLKANSPLAPRTFVCTSSRPTVLKGFSKVTTDELVRPLLRSLHTDFHLCGLPENYFSRGGTEVTGGKDPAIQMVAIGASNLLQTVPHLAGEFGNVTDLTKRGWIATKTNVAVALESLLATDSNRDNSVLVFDLFSNFVHRYRQCDDTLSLPYRAGNGYHMGGDIEVVTDSCFKTVVELTFPLLAAHPNAAKIVIPPSPRFLFTGCCTEKTHSCNVGTPGHAQSLLEKVQRLRKILKNYVASSGLKNCWVLETCYMVDSPTEMTMEELLPRLKNSCARDGVHFTTMGYVNTAKVVTKTAMYLLNKKTANSSTATNTVPGHGRTTHYWRGFTSPVGSAKPSFSATGYRMQNQGRERQQFHPYRRGRGAPYISHRGRKN
jgi:hypothetical protein